MHSPRFRYSEILETVQETPNPYEIALIATTLGSGHDPNLGPWFQEAIQSRYHEFTQAGLPDGPRYERPYLVR